MLSRRKFLQTNAAGLALPLAGPRGGARPALGAANTSPANASSARDYWKDWPLYFTAKVNEARAHRRAALQNLGDKSQALERVRAVRARVWELVGGQLEKTPLN